MSNSTPADLLARARAALGSDRLQAAELAGAALAEARAAGDLRTQTQSLNLLAEAARAAGDAALAEARAREALASAEGCGDAGGQAVALSTLGALDWHRGELDRAVGYVRRALELRTRLGDERGIAACSGNLALLHIELGDLAQAMEHQQHALALRRTLGDARGLGVAYLNQGVLYADLGDWDKALECYFRALAEKERAGDTADTALCYNNIAELYLYRGRLDRARFYLDQALALAEQADARWVTAEVLGTLGATAAAGQDFAAARACFERDRDICLALNEREELAETLRRLAELELAGGATAEAARLAADALDTATAAGARREAANIQRVLGECLAGGGDHAAALERFGQAEQALRRLGRNYELAQVRLARARLPNIAEQERKSAAADARTIFESLGALELAAIAADIAGARAPEPARPDLLADLAALAAAGRPSAEFAERAVALLADRLDAADATVFLRDGRVFRSRTATAVGDRPLSFPLEAGGRRVGTLTVSATVGPASVRPAADLIALGLLQSGAARSAAVPGPRAEPRAQPAGADIIGAATSLRAVVATVERAAPTRASVLILGESGTGKELIARLLHQRSDRSKGPFIAVNCAAIPENLLEAELFGIERGTATGVAARVGRFESADSGTVFLDEIGDMSLALQSKLLRVLQERSFERVGSTATRSVDIRVIAATNRDLAAAIAASRFRQDLLFRLNVITLTLPPLRERKHDIPALAGHFLERTSREYGKPVRGLTEDCLACLVAWDWPGNVRELENVIERGVILAEGEDLIPADLPPALVRETALPDWREARDRVERAAAAPVEQQAVIQALEQSAGNATQAARRLGISRRQLYRLMDKHHIRRPRDSAC